MSRDQMTGAQAQTPAPRATLGVKLALLGFGLLLLLALELLLRLTLPAPASSGFSAAPLFELDCGSGEDCWWVLAEGRSHSFQPVRFAHPKPERGLRIFCLGGSSVWGYPYGAEVAFPRRLERLLRERHPQRAVEVINLGGLSYGSRRLAMLAEQLARWQPDVVVVYSGHNEFVERDLAASAGLGRLERLRIVSALRQLLANAPGASAETGAASFGIDVVRREGRLVSAAEREQARRDYRANMERVVSAVRQAGALPLLATVGVNLADWRPGGGRLGEGLPALELLALAAELARARSTLAAAPESALDLYERVLERGEHALVRFEHGRLARRLQRPELARASLWAAVELDTTPIRALPGFNPELRQLARAASLPLLDAEQLLRVQVDDGVLDGSLFWDYCHPNGLAHDLIAQGLAGVLERGELGPAAEGPLEPRARPLEPPPETAFAVWWLGNVAQRQGRPDLAEPLLRRALELQPDQYRALVGLAQLLPMRGAREEALELARRAAELAPGSVLAAATRGRLAWQLGHAEEARAAFERAAASDPRAAGVWLNLGALALSERRLGDAREALERERSLHPTTPGLFRNLGLLELLEERLEPASQAFLEALLQDPADARSAFHLAASWERLGRPTQALAAARLAVELAPSDSAARELLGRLMPPTAQPAGPAAASGAGS